MKKILALITLGLLCLSLIACNAKNTDTQSQTTEPVTTSAIETTAAPTQKPTEKPTEKATEPPTQAPTEDITKKANAAYLEYIKSRPEYFTDYNDIGNVYGTIMDGKIFAVYDINGDGVDELFYVHPNTEENGRLNFSIVTYDGKVKELYDDILVNLPGSESEYFVFVGEDNKLYSVMSKELWGHVIRFDMEGDNFSADVLAKSDAFHLAKPEDAKCTKDGEPVSYDEFYMYMGSVNAGAKKYLLLSYNRTTELENLSMSYDEAVEYLEKHS